jgi:hypothetical protein
MKRKVVGFQWLKNKKCKFKIEGARTKKLQKLIQVAPNDSTVFDFYDLPASMY